MTEPNEAIKPCPHCCGKAVCNDAGPDITGRAYQVTCKKCQAGSGWFFSKAEAIAAWSTRPDPLAMARAMQEAAIGIVDSIGDACSDNGVLRYASAALSTIDPATLAPVAGEVERIVEWLRGPFTLQAAYVCHGSVSEMAADAIERREWEKPDAPA